MFSVKRRDKVLLGVSGALVVFGVCTFCLGAAGELGQPARAVVGSWRPSGSDRLGSAPGRATGRAPAEPASSAPGAEGSGPDGSGAGGSVLDGASFATGGNGLTGRAAPVVPVAAPGGRDGAVIPPYAGGTDPGTLPAGATDADTWPTGGTVTDGTIGSGDIGGTGTGTGTGDSGTVGSGAGSPPAPAPAPDETTTEPAAEPPPAAPEPTTDAPTSETATASS